MASWSERLDTYVAQLMSVKGEVFYEAKDSEQLRLFEDMETYLVKQEIGIDLINQPVPADGRNPWHPI